MRLQELFPPADILVDFEAVDKWQALELLITHLRERDRLPEAHEADHREAVLNRERQMSTGMERGIAIPHAAVGGIDDVVACLAISRHGLSFDSIDARPAHLIVLLLIPHAKKLQNIRTLGDIARVLGKPSVRTALLAAATSEEAWHALGEGDGPRT